MKNNIGTLILTIITLCILNVTNIVAQDLVPFEVVNNDEVGLTVAPYSKWGMAVGDINKDGYPDIFCIRWNGADNYSRLYLNTGGHFQDISQQTPLPQIEGQSISPETRTTVFVDFDNDGDQDISFGTPEQIYLLRNDDNTFVDVSDETGFRGQKPGGFISTWEYSVGGWADYDLDGDLDCVVSQQNYDNLYLFRNDGDHFTDVATEAGLDGTVLSEQSRLSWFDIDLDGDPDLYSAYNFFRNDNGVFTDMTEEIGLGGLEYVAYREFLDFDNDGDFDFFKVVGASEDPGENQLWENRDGVFVNVTGDVGLQLNADRYRSMTVGDFDNDGDVDIFVQLNIDPSLDVLLINDLLEDGSRGLANVADFVEITKTGDRKGSAFLDYDKDGFLDIYLPSAEFNHILYHNLGGNGANWVVLMLEGTVSNKDAVGSLVKLCAGGKEQFRYTRAGNGWLRQDNPHVHFGLGYETSIDSIVIRWPLGQKQVLTDVAINQYHKIKESDPTSVKKLDGGVLPVEFQLEQNYPNPFNPSTTITYHVPEKANVVINIFDISGRQVKELINRQHAAGSYSIDWSGKDDKSNPLPSGIYVYLLRSGNTSIFKKMLFVK
ncbi:VCBS repeat-containing protein [candidate division KSB1 bacterium]|nr:VCBS repeat-containing protein [candidate division KSB1 bacterium]